MTESKMSFHVQYIVHVHLFTVSLALCITIKNGCMESGIVNIHGKSELRDV
jgi:hypothetical protein